MIKTLVAALLAVLVYVPVARAQAGPEGGGSEIQVWTSGGHATNGVASDTGMWNLGFRYGRVLTGAHGPGFLRGRLEYAVEGVPVFVVFQKTNTAYGAGINPFAFKWNFATHRNVVPYMEIAGGTLFTNTKVPEGASRVNFTTSGALGLHFLRSKYNWNAEVRFMHISNAGLERLNPGINAIQFRIGLGRFLR